jgi:predicted secreted protein
MALKGCGASFLLGTDVVASLNSISNPFTRETLDVTSFDSDCLREFLDGLGSGTIEISGDFDPDDTNGQMALQTAVYAGTKLTSTQKPSILWDGSNGIEADAYVSSLSISASVDGKVEFSCTLQLTGTISVVS